MISIISEEGHKKYRIYEYVIDSSSEISNLPDKAQAGSVAYCIENSKTYMKNHSNQWIEVNFKSGGGSGSKNLPIHICTVMEYNAVTRIPTIENPDTNMFYLVPAANGTSPNMFMEYIYANNSWELFGSVAIDLSDYATKAEVLKKADYSVEEWTFTLEDDSTVTKKVVVEK